MYTMHIKNNKIIIEDSEISLGMSFEEARDVLNKKIQRELEPDEYGLGHIFLKNINFYELKGECDLFFSDNILNQIIMKPQWNYYNLRDLAGEALKIDIVVKKVAEINEEGLTKAFGTPLEGSTKKHRIFKAENIDVLAFISKFNDNYSVSIGKFLEKD